METQKARESQNGTTDSKDAPLSREDGTTLPGTIDDVKEEGGSNKGKEGQGGEGDKGGGGSYEKLVEGIKGEQMEEGEEPEGAFRGSDAFRRGGARGRGEDE